MNETRPNLKVTLEQTMLLAEQVNSPGTFKITVSPRNAHIENINDISVYIEPPINPTRLSGLEEVDKSNYSFSISSNRHEGERLRDISIYAALKDKNGLVHHVGKSYNALL